MIVYSQTTPGTYTFPTVVGTRYMAIAIGAGGAGGPGYGDEGGSDGGGGGNGGGVAMGYFDGSGGNISITVGSGGVGTILQTSDTETMTIATDGSTSWRDGGIRGQDGGDSSVTLGNVEITGEGGPGGLCISNHTHVQAGGDGNVAGITDTNDKRTYSGSGGGVSNAQGDSADATDGGSLTSRDIFGTPGQGGSPTNNYWDTAGGGGGVAGFSYGWSSFSADVFDGITLGTGGDGGDGQDGGASNETAHNHATMDGGDATGIGAGGGGTGANGWWTGWYPGGDGSDGAVFILVDNTPPISLFFANTSEGLQLEITDFSSDPNGQEDLRKWEFSFNAAGKYYGSGTTVLANVSDVLTFDLDGTTNASTATFATAPPASFFFRYNTEGTRDIELTVTDGSGATHMSQLPEPYVAVSLDPTAAFYVETYRDNRTMDLVDSSDDVDGDIVTRAWNFGDGNTETYTDGTTTLSHTYATDGVYDVSLTVTDNVGKTNTVTQQVDIPRANANVIFVNSGPICLSVNTMSVSTINPSTNNYRGPAWVPWYRTVDVIGTDAAKAAQAMGNPAMGPTSLKTVTESAENDYNVDFFAPANASAPYAMSEFYQAEIPPPAVSTPFPEGVEVGNGLYSVSFDSQTYFQIFIDTSGSMNSYVGSYQNASVSVQADMAAVFFNNDEALARKYVKPYVRISNERWGDWAMTHHPGPDEAQKQVIIAAINEDSSGGQGTGNSAILAKAQAMFDSGGHYYFILIAPPGSNAGSLYSQGPALASTRVTVGGEQKRWCQFSRESAKDGALTNVIKQILGFQAV